MMSCNFIHQTKRIIPAWFSNAETAGRDAASCDVPIKNLERGFRFLPLPSSSFLFLPLPSSSFLFLPLPSSSFLFLPLPSSSFLFLPLPSSSFLFLPPDIWNSQNNFPSSPCGGADFLLRCWPPAQSPRS